MVYFAWSMTSSPVITQHSIVKALLSVCMYFIYYWYKFMVSQLPSTLLPSIVNSYYCSSIFLMLRQSQILTLGPFAFCLPYPFICPHHCSEQVIIFILTKTHLMPIISLALEPAIPLKSPAHYSWGMILETKIGTLGVHVAAGYLCIFASG